MANPRQKLIQICRFCLSEDKTRLSCIANILSASLTYEDVGSFTGIEIEPGEDCASYAICHKCKDFLRKCAQFRRSCLSNQAKFRELYTISHSSAKRAFYESSESDEAEEIDDPSYRDAFIEKDTKHQVLLDDPIIIEEGSDETLCSTASRYTNDEEMYSANYIEIGEPYDSDHEDDKTKRLPHTLPKRRARKSRYDPFAIDWSNGQQANKRKEKQVLDLSTARNNPAFFVKKYKNELRVYPKTLCEVCGIFVVGIGQHLVNHQPGSMHKCPYCMVKMKQKTNIMAHINTVHFKTIGKTCGICGKGFVHHKTYRHHMLTHEGEDKIVRVPRSYENVS